jgi:hypothetical protein
MRWPDLGSLWERVLEAGPWYVYAVAEPPPREPLDTDALRGFLAELDELLRREHAHDYCGIVYADDLEQPTMVKIFDPNRLGACCGSSGVCVLPGWVLSRQTPTALPVQAPTAARRAWWQRWSLRTSQT